MKENLDSKSRTDLIYYRLQRAKETIAEADFNAAGGYYNAAVNRLYYACYYAASALMLKSNLDVSTHKGIRNQLGLHFINKGIIDSNYGAIYSRLFHARQSGDYEDFIFCNEDMYITYRPDAIEFINKIQSLILSKENDYQ